jgi:hypothetical protein
MTNISDNPFEGMDARTSLFDIKIDPETSKAFTSPRSGNGTYVDEMQEDKSLMGIFVNARTFLRQP